MANVTGLVPITGGVIRMALLSEKPQPHTTGSWEGQRVLAESVGHVLSWRASGLRYEDSTGSNSRTGAPLVQLDSEAQGLRSRSRHPRPLPVPANPRPRETPTFGPQLGPLEIHSVVSHGLHELAFKVRPEVPGRKGRMGLVVPAAPWR